MVGLFVAFLALAISYWIFVGRKHPSGFPPSPTFSLPIIGDGLVLGEQLPVGFDKLKQRCRFRFKCYHFDTKDVIASHFQVWRHIWDMVRPCSSCGSEYIW